MQLQMSNLLIGSSNINRHFKATDFPNSRQYKMVKCTQMPGFTSYMENLKDDNEAVLISVFENFVVDAVGADTVEPESHIDKCIMEFLGTINSSATRLPKTKFGVVMPLRRPALLWYQQRLDLMTKFLEEGIRSMIREKSVNNVTIISSITEVSQQFEDDKIHLTKPSAKVFLEVIITAAEKFFSAPLVDLTEQGEVHDDDDDDEIQGKMKSMEEYGFSRRASAKRRFCSAICFSM